MIDTNFINFSVQNKLDILKNSMDLLLGKVIPVETDCVVTELEKLGSRYRMALKIIKYLRFQKVKCDHKAILINVRFINRASMLTILW